MKVVAIPFNIKEIKDWSFYRIHQPYGYLKNVLSKDIFMYDSGIHDIKRLNDEVHQADVIVCHHPISEKMLKLFRAIMTWKDRKRSVVVDFDDDPFNVSPWNPSYCTWGTKESSVLYSDREQVADLLSVIPESQRKLLQINQDGSASVTMFKDKENGFDIEANLSRQKTVQDIIKEVDLLTVTTSQLAEAFKQYRPKGKIAVLPNLVDFNRYSLMNKRNDGKLRIVWQGSLSHYRDLVMVKVELISFARKHPEVEYLFQGVSYPGLFHALGDRAKWIPWHPDIYTYPQSLRELSGDIALCPLTDDAFNAGKSPLKWEEMSAMKVPCVCSPTVYSDYVEHGKSGFIARQGEWETYLEKLLDPKEREQIGQNAYDQVKKEFSIEKASLYWSTLQDIASGL